MRLAVQQDAAAVRRLVAGEDLHQRALAGAVLAQQAIDVAWLEGEVEVLVGLHLAEAFANVLQLYAHGLRKHNRGFEGDRQIVWQLGMFGVCDPTI